MARPTTEKKETTIIVRISEEQKDNLASKAKAQNKKLSEYIREILKGENSVIQNSDKTEENENKKNWQPLPSFKIETLPNMKEMADFFEISLEELFEGVNKGLYDGTLTVINGRVVGVPGIDLDRFYDVCHDMNVDPQETIYKVTHMVERGQI